jgi:hypothetical protein
MMAGAHWIDLGGSLTATNSLNSGPQRYYRVQRVN